MISHFPKNLLRGTWELHHSKNYQLRSFTIPPEWDKNYQQIQDRSGAKKEAAVRRLIFPKVWKIEPPLSWPLSVWRLYLKKQSICYHLYLGLQGQLTVFNPRKICLSNWCQDTQMGSWESIQWTLLDSIHCRHLLIEDGPECEWSLWISPARLLGFCLHSIWIFKIHCKAVKTLTDNNSEHKGKMLTC